MGPIGMQEMMLIFVIALLLFGPKKLPELGKILGKGLSEFRRAKNELKSTFETHLHELEREAKVDSDPKTTSPSYASPRYPYTFDEYGKSEPDYSSPSAIPESNSSEHASATDSPVSSPVEGTVPRTNGVQPAETAAVAVNEEHPA